MHILNLAVSFKIIKHPQLTFFSKLFFVNHELLYWMGCLSKVSFRAWSQLSSYIKKLKKSVLRQSLPSALKQVKQSSPYWEALFHVSILNEKIPLWIVTSILSLFPFSMRKKIFSKIVFFLKISLASFSDTFVLQWQPKNIIVGQVRPFYIYMIHFLQPNTIQMSP